MSYYQCSAPGSVMLMGEHAVLRGALALVAAIDKRIDLRLTPKDDGIIDIFSALGEWHIPVAELEQCEFDNIKFIMTILKAYHKKIATGFRLDINSEFSSTVGLGSSAAIVVALLSCLHQWIEPVDHQTLFLEARSFIQKVQGCGSGADAAASIFGGIIAYQLTPLRIEKLPHLFPMALIYTGYKTPTHEVIGCVNQQEKQNPEHYAMLFAAINTSSEKALLAIQEQDWHHLGKIMLDHQTLQEELGICDPKTKTLIDLLKKNPHVLGCKISGSGLGDCVLALTDTAFQWHDKAFIHIPAQLSSTGLLP